MMEIPHPMFTTIGVKYDKPPCTVHIHILCNFILIISQFLYKVWYMKTTSSLAHCPIRMDEWEM